MRTKCKGRKMLGVRAAKAKNTPGFFGSIGIVIIGTQAVLAA